MRGMEVPDYGFLESNLELQISCTYSFSIAYHEVYVLSKVSM
jgi:hypothetical protein